MVRRKHYNINAMEGNGGPHEDSDDNEPEYGTTKSTASVSSSKDRDNGSMADCKQDTSQIPDTRDTVCGFLCLKSPCLQSLANMKFFTFIYGISMLLAISIGMYFTSQITTLEKQFGLSSTQSGILMSANDVGFLVTVLFWSHFTRKAHKPIILGVASMIFGLACILIALPHFILNKEGGATSAALTGGMGGLGILCVSGNVSRLGSMARGNSSESGSEMETDSSGAYRSAYIMIAAGMALQGIVKAPRRPAGMTYLDDNVPKTKLGLYFGVIMGMVIFGPVIGSAFGATFSQMYVTLEDTNMSMRDPRWIGAWWLGFLVLGGISVITAIPLIFFPKRMPGGNVTQHTDETAKSLVADFPKSALRLAKNPLYILLTATEGILMFAMSGAASFFPKYIEQHFLVPTWKAGILMGVPVIVAGVVGSILSGMLTSCLKLTILGCMVVICLSDGVNAIVPFVGLAIKCTQPKLHGLSSPSPAISHLAVEMTNWTCASGCTPGCSEAQFLPTCGADGLTYFSPCHAGCTGVLPNMTFTDCSCVSSPYGDTAIPGYCEEQCDTLPAFIASIFFLVFVAILTSVPQSIIKLRCVKERDRSLALGFNGFFASLIGFLLGPIVFGTVIDSTCLLWQVKPGNNGGGYCTLYDTAEIRLKLHTLIGGVRVGVLILALISMVIVIRLPRYKKIVQTQRDQYTADADEANQKKKTMKGGMSSPDVIKNGVQAPEQDTTARDNVIPGATMARDNVIPGDTPANTDNECVEQQMKRADNTLSGEENVAETDVSDMSGGRSMEADDMQPSQPGLTDVSLDDLPNATDPHPIMDQDKYLLIDNNSRVARESAVFSNEGYTEDDDNAENIATETGVI